MRLKGLLAAVTTSCLVLFLHAGAGAQTDPEREQARQEFNRGVTLYQEGAWNAALGAFQEAYRLRPHPSVRVNMANCYERLNRPLEAIFHFESFLDEAGANATRDQKREVEAALARLRRQVGELTLRVSPDGALVRIDSTETRRAPIVEPVRLTAGNHSIEVSLDGYRSVRRQVEVPGGGDANLEVRLERGADVAVATLPPSLPPPQRTPEPQVRPQPLESPRPPTRSTAATSPPTGSASRQPATGSSDSAAAVSEPNFSRPPGGQPRDQERSSGPRVTPAAIGVGIATLAVGVGAAITGGMALGAESDFDAAVEASNDPDATDAEREAAIDQGERDADKADTLAAVTDILIGAAVVGAGVTLALILTAGPEEEETGDPALVMKPVASTDGAGFMLVGRW